MQIVAGSIIDGRLEVISELGTGGMGAVYLAKQPGLDRLVAVKLLHTGSSPPEQLLSRFEREAKILKGLKHKHIVSVYGFGVWQNSPYIVFEYLSGTSLNTILQSGPLPMDFCLKMMIQVGEALACAHRHDILHRDLKPANIMIEADGSAKVIDFGLARFAAGDQAITQEGQVLGTVLYMSPEQCRGEPVDRRTDVYSFGCLLYECLTGTNPFNGNCTIVVMHKHAFDEVKSIGDMRAELSHVAEADKIIKKCLAKNPSDRYASMEEVIADLESLQVAEPVQTAPETLQTRADVHLRRKIDNRRFVAVVTALAASFIFGLAFWNADLAKKQIRTSIPSLSSQKVQAKHFYERFNFLTQRAASNSDSSKQALKDLLSFARSHADEYPTALAEALLENSSRNKELSANEKSAMVNEARTLLAPRVGKITQPTIIDKDAMEQMGWSIVLHERKPIGASPFFSEAVRLGRAIPLDKSASLAALSGLGFTQYCKGERKEGAELMIRSAEQQCLERNIGSRKAAPLLMALSAELESPSRDRCIRLLKAFPPDLTSGPVRNNLVEWWRRFWRLHLENNDKATLLRLFNESHNIKDVQLRDHLLVCLIGDADDRGKELSDTALTEQLARNFVERYPDSKVAAPYDVIYRAAMAKCHYPEAIHCLDELIARSSPDVAASKRYEDTKRSLKAQMAYEVALNARNYPAAVAALRYRVELARELGQPADYRESMEKTLKAMELYCQGLQIEQRHKDRVSSRGQLGAKRHKD